MTLGVLEILSILLVPVLLGASVLRAARNRASEDPIAYAGWSFVVGSLLVALAVLATLAAGLSPKAVWLSPILVAVSLLIFLLRRRAQEPGTKDESALAPRRCAKLEAALFHVVLALLVVLFALKILSTNARPIVDSDEATIWAAKAKILFATASLGERLGAAVGKKGVFVAHADYPLLNPLLQIWTFAHAGEILHIDNRLPIQSASLALVLVLAGALRRRVRPFVASVLLIVGTVNVETLHFGTLAYSDTLVALGLVTALDGLDLYMRTSKRRFLLLAAAGLALSVFAKNDGVAILIAFASAVALSRFFRRLPRLGPALGACLPALLLLALTWSLNRGAGFANDLVQDVTKPGAAAAILEALGHRLSAFGNHLVSNPFARTWQSRWLLLAFLAVLLSAPRRCLAHPILVPTLTLLLLALAHAVIFTLTPKPIEWHLQTAAGRVFGQSTPALSLWLALAASTVRATAVSRTADT